MKEWREVKLGEVGEVIGGGTPSTKILEYWDGNIAWLTPRDLSGYSKMYIERGERNITEEGYKNSSARLMPKGTVLLSSRAPIGYIAIAKNDISTNQGFKSIIVDELKLNNEFLYFWLKANIDYLKQLGTGTTFAEISGAVVKDIDILLPPLPEQKAIAQVLSSLDDKIELLNQQNKTLEQMAETLFRQWFVEEADEDWEEVELGDKIKISSGKGLKRSEYVTNGSFPVLGANGEIGRTNNFLFNERLIFTGRVGTLGNVFRVENEKVWLSDNTLIIKSGEYYNLIYFFLKNAKLENYNVGSTQPLIRQSDIKELIIYLPTDSKKILKFEKESELYFEKIKSNQSQIQTLTSLRDTLLPKLMSGEVRVDMN